MWAYLDDDGRILATTIVEEYADGMTEIVVPDGFDPLSQTDWRIVDGTPVYDPLPDEEPESEGDADGLESQLRTASMLFVRSNARTLSDGDALSVSLLFADWDETSSYARGDVVRYSGELWRCRSAHDAQPSWAPDEAHSLWGRIVPPGTIEAWRQPQPGIFDGYTLGQRVTHNGLTWESTYDGLNVWEPGVTGTEALWREVN